MPGPLAGIGALDKWVVTVVLLPGFPTTDTGKFEQALSSTLKAYEDQERNAGRVPPSRSAPVRKGKVITFEINGPMTGSQADACFFTLKSLDETYRNTDGTRTKLKWPSFDFTEPGRPVQHVHRGRTQQLGTWSKPANWDSLAEQGEGT